jgi:CubicO group peptidase (beta-lactamase class C family)
MQLGEVRLDGETYTAAEVTRVEPDGLVITHSSGIARIPYEKLPQDLQKSFQFNPAQAQAHRSKKSELEQAKRRAAQTRKDTKPEPAAIDFSQPAGVPTETEESSSAIPAPTESCMAFGSARPADEGVDEEKLYELAKYIRDERKLPIFSLLISRNGKVIFELYTGGIDPGASHYLMSVTKSMLSTLIGVAIDKGILPSEDKPLSQVLPNEAFKNKRHQAKFDTVNLMNVMEMSALDAPVPPHDNSSRAAARGAGFFSSKNRLEFSLEEDLLKSPGFEHQYNDITPALASGALSYASGKSAFDFAREHLFEPLGFRNAEWMHQDETGIDMGGYGLRLRPIDMQKWGVLFLNSGLWDGKRIISDGRVSKSATPSIAAGSREPNYGWFWWRQNYGTPLVFQEANGWKGQRLAINHDKQIVVSMTACIEGDREHEFFAKIIRDYVVPSIDPQSGPKKNNALGDALMKLRKSRPRYSSSMEERMIPSIEPKERRKPLKL